MRLIDADELKLGKFVEPRTEWHLGWNDALDAATTQAPTIDAVPVVRCRDCENHRWYTNRYGVEISTCTLLCVDVGIDDFCSYGERRDTHGN